MATGGDPTTESEDQTEEEMDQLFASLKNLTAGDRRRTLSRFRRSLEGDVLPPPLASPPETQSTGRTVNQLGERQKIIIDNSVRKIKNFSGLKRYAPGEVDYTHWRRSAMQIALDPELSSNKKRVFVLQSLCGEAEDNVDLIRDKSAMEIIKFLDTIYNSVADDHDMMADFFQLVQEPSQSASDYATLLYRNLGEMVNARVVKEQELGKLLVKQFSRGLNDENLVVKLRLDELADTPPLFTDLLTKVRKEELRRSERQARVKKQVRSHMTSVEVESEDEGNTEEGKSDQMDEVLNRLSQLETITLATHPVINQVKKPPPFCYRCGIDNHLAYDCPNPPNRELVNSKYEQRSKLYGANPKNGSNLRLRAATRR